MGKISVTYKDTKYTLEYTKRTVQTMESRGFDLADITEQKKLATAIPMLWQGAFLAHHNPADKTAKDPVDRKLADEIYTVFLNPDVEPSTILPLGIALTAACISS